MPEIGKSNWFGAAAAAIKRSIPGTQKDQVISRPDPSERYAPQRYVASTYDPTGVDKGMAQTVPEQRQNGLRDLLGALEPRRYYYPPMGEPNVGSIMPQLSMTTAVPQSSVMIPEKPKEGNGQTSIQPVSVQPMAIGTLNPPPEKLPAPVRATDKPTGKGGLGGLNFKPPDVLKMIAARRK